MLASRWGATALLCRKGAQLTFQTLDGDSQQVNSDEIWRIRATYTSDEPTDAIVIDYGLGRVYVKESLASVVEKVGGVRPLKRFTLPCGGPVYIVAHEGDRRHPRHPRTCLTRMPMRSSSRAKARPRFRRRAKPSTKRWVK